MNSSTSIRWERWVALSQGASSGASCKAQVARFAG
jgi:hypothetical protein